MVDKAIFNCFLSMWSQNIPLSATMFQDKALIFAKGLNVENFQASDGWLRRWKERNHVTFKAASGESKYMMGDVKVKVGISPKIINEIFWFSKNSGIQLEKTSIIIILFNSEVNLQLV